MLANRPRPSGTTEMPRPMRSWVGTPVRSRPANTTRPATGWTTPPTALTSDDLPAPLGPTRPTISPESTCRPTLSTAKNGPYRTVMPESSSIDAAKIVFHDALVGEDVARRTVGDLLAGEQDHDPIGELSDHLHGVLDQEYRAARLEFGQQGDHGAHFVRREPA